MAEAGAAAEPMNGVEGGAPPLPTQTEELDLEHYSHLKFFEVERKIGHGQFSVVYRARNTVDGKVVALKKIQVSPPLQLLSRRFASGVVICIYSDL